MCTLTDISPELEQIVEANHRQLVEALQPRDEMRIQKMVRLDSVFRAYEKIVYSLPIERNEVYRLTGEYGEIDIFKDDSRNARILLGAAFGYAVAQGGKSLFPQEKVGDLAALKKDALKVYESHTACVGIIFPPIIELSTLRKYGKHLGYHSQVEEVSSMFAAINSLELQSNILKR